MSPIINLLQYSHIIISKTSFHNIAFSLKSHLSSIILFPVFHSRLGDLVSPKWVILEFMFAENQKHYSVTDHIRGRRPMSTVISVFHLADITRKIEHILVSQCPKVSEMEEVLDHNVGLICMRHNPWELMAICLRRPLNSE